MTSETPELAAPSTDSPGRWRAAWPYLLVLIVGSLVLLPRLGEFGFWDPWEPKYAQSAKEMTERGSYIVPFLREEERLTKPILVYWGILAGTGLFGVNEFGARIVGVLFSLASLVGVCYAVGLLRGRRAGLLSALVLATLPQFYLISRQAMPDAYLMTSIGIAVLFLALGMFGPERRRDLHFGISYAGFGLALLAKGPVIACGVYFVPLILFALAQIDVPRLWERDLRMPTARTAAYVVFALALAGVCTAGAFAFGTSYEWWGYSDTMRDAFAERREALLGTLDRLRVGEVVLAALALLASGLAWRLRRSSGPRSRLRLAAPWICGTAAVVALLALVALGPVARLAVASLLGLGASIVGCVSAVRAYLLRPEIAPAIRPLFKPVRRQVLLFLAVVAIVAGPWHVAIFAERGHGFFTDFIVKHNLTRAEETINRGGSADFYVKTLIFGGLPWSAVLPLALALLVEWWRRDALRRQGLEIFLLVTMVVTLVPLSTAATKFAHYMSPVLLPFGVLVGLTLDRLITERRALTATIAWATAGLLYLPILFDVIGSDGMKYVVRSMTMKDTIPESAAAGEAFHVMLWSVAAVLAGLVLFRFRALVGVLVATAVVIAVYVNGVFIPELSYHKSMKRVCQSYHDLRLDQQRLGYYGDTKHGLYYYLAPGEMNRLSTNRETVDHLAPGPRALALVRNKYVAKVESLYARTYPQDQLWVVDDSHFSYTLLSNEKIGRGLSLHEWATGEGEGED